MSNATMTAAKTTKTTTGRENARRSNSTKFDTREEWLAAAIDAFRVRFAKAGKPLPKALKATCGWPSSRGTAARGRVLGECWHPKVSAKGTVEIFVTPYVDDGSRVLDILLHECAHAALGTEAGHGVEFAALCKALGLDGKPTSTVASDELKAEFKASLLPALGLYPHAKMDVTEWTVSDKPKKQVGSRMVKCACKACGYTVRTTQKWLDVAAPTCPNDDCDKVGEAMQVGAKPAPMQGRPGEIIPPF